MELDSDDYRNHDDPDQRSPGVDVLARLERMAREAKAWRDEAAKAGAVFSVSDGQDREAITAVRSLIEREAALAAEHAEDQAVIAVWRGRCERAEAERDAQSKRITILEGEAYAQAQAAERFRLQLRAMQAERSELAERVAEYVEARDAYEAATRPGISHGQPKRLAYSDPVLIRYREARAALAACKSPQKPT